ncbi:MAG TPA: universal stress protein [Acidobacteriaceae bacterium]|nr:universal stress protein [Acidobacteriaceae bacterium]
MVGYKQSLKTIMLATDLSSASCGALNYARQLAKLFCARLLVVHVIDPNAACSGTAPEKTRIAEFMGPAEEKLQKISASLAYDFIRHSTIVRHGDIRETILRLVRDRQVDLLVTGARGGCGKEDDRAQGSVAEMLLRSMPCPVMTVGSNVRQDAFEGTHLRRVLLPTDLSEELPSAVVYAERLTQFLAGQLILMHVAQEAPGPADNGISAQLEPFASVLKKMEDPSIVAGYINREGPTADAIVRVANEKHVDLIVLGAYEGREPSGRRTQRVVSNVIRSARCPVFTVCPSAHLSP